MGMKVPVTAGPTFISWWQLRSVVNIVDCIIQLGFTVFHGKFSKILQFTATKLSKFRGFV